MPYSSLEESPTSAVPDVGRRQVGRVADGAPVVGRQRGHRLCGDLSEGGDLELHPRRQALPQSVHARGHGGCALAGQCTMVWSLAGRCRFK